MTEIDKIKQDIDDYINQTTESEIYSELQSQLIKLDEESWKIVIEHLNTKYNPNPWNLPKSYISTAIIGSLFLSSYLKTVRDFTSPLLLLLRGAGSSSLFLLILVYQFIAAEVHILQQGLSKKIYRQNARINRILKFNNKVFTECRVEFASFWNHKIDFNNPLGAGKYGQVFPLVKRPNWERYLLPIIPAHYLDYYLTIDKPKPSQLCVKIPYSFVRTFYKYRNSHPREAYYEIKRTLWDEPTREQETNRVLSKYKLSRIKFYNSEVADYQIKTKINGDNLSVYFFDKSLVSENHYQLRKTLFDLFYKIKNAPVKAFDIHRENIMFDNETNTLEIIDGIVTELDTTYPQLVRLEQEVLTPMYVGFFNIDPCTINDCTDKKSVYVLHSLAQLTTNHSKYTDNLDKTIIAGLANTDYKDKAELRARQLIQARRDYKFLFRYPDAIQNHNQLSQSLVQEQKKSL